MLTHDDLTQQRSAASHATRAARRERAAANLSRRTARWGQATPTMRPPAGLPRPEEAAPPAAAQTNGSSPFATMASSPSWSGFNPANSIVDEGGFPRVNFGSMYDTAKRNLTENTYNTAADAGFGALRAGPYVASLHQNLGALEGQMAGKAADLAEAEAGRRLSQLMQREQIGSQEKMQGASIASAEKMQGAELGSRASLQEAQLAAEKARLGMELSSREKLALSELTEQGRQFDAGLGERSAEYGSDLAFRQQQAEDARLMQWLQMVLGGATGFTEPVGRVVPGGYSTPRSSNPFSSLLSGITGGLGTGIGIGMFN